MAVSIILVVIWFFAILHVGREFKEITQCSTVE